MKNYTIDDITHGLVVQRSGTNYKAVSAGRKYSTICFEEDSDDQLRMYVYITNITTLLEHLNAGKCRVAIYDMNHDSNVFCELKVRLGYLSSI